MYLPDEPVRENEISHIYVRATSSNVSVSPMHSHSEWEVLFVRRGSGEVEIPGYSSIPLSAGTIVCMPPRIIHESHVVRPYRSITFRMENSQLSHEEQPFSLQDNVSGDFKMLCTMMLRLYIEDAKENESMIRHLILCMHEYIRKNVDSTGSKYKCVGKVKQQICENFGDSNLDINELIAGSGYSPNHFRACFLEAVGKTPLQYLLSVRMQYAEQLLQTERRELKIMEVAEQCGFSDPMYFSRMYKRIKGISPTEAKRGREEL